MNPVDFYKTKTQNGSNQNTRLKSEHTILALNELTLIEPLTETDISVLVQFSKLNILRLPNGVASENVLALLGQAQLPHLKQIHIENTQSEAPTFLLKNENIETLSMSGGPWSPFVSNKLLSLSLTIKSDYVLLDLSKLTGLTHLTMDFAIEPKEILFPLHTLESLLMVNSQKHPLNLSKTKIHNLPACKHLQLREVEFSEQPVFTFKKTERLTLFSPQNLTYINNDFFPNLLSLSLLNTEKLPNTNQLMGISNLNKLHVTGKDGLKASLTALQKAHPNLKLTANLSCKDSFTEWRLADGNWEQINSR